VSDEEFQAQHYWEERLATNLGLTTVGHAGLGYAYNAWLYRARYRALRRALATTNVNVRDGAVAEVGVGSGAYIPFWQAQGIRHLTGFDITQVSADTLSVRYPEYAFYQCDIGATLPAAARRNHDLVTAFDVLFHIVDDASFANAIANLARLIRPGGHAVISDSLADRAWGPTRTEYHRTFEHYRGEMAKNGLSVAGIEPIFYTMTTTFAGAPVLARFTRRATRAIGKLAARPVTAWVNQMSGAALYLADGMLARSGERGPSLNLLVAVRDGGDAAAT
jgi:SAM-dependent methyltransferase